MTKQPKSSPTRGTILLSDRGVLPSFEDEPEPEPEPVPPPEPEPASYCYNCGRSDHVFSKAGVVDCPTSPQYGAEYAADLGMAPPDRDWQQWLERYISEDVALDDYLASVGLGPSVVSNGPQSLESLEQVLPTPPPPIRRA